MRNIVAFELSRRLGLAYTPYCQPVDVILNGEYKGCYQLCDQITVDKNRVAIAKMEPGYNDEPLITGGYLVEVDAYASQETSWFNSLHGIPVTIKSPSDDAITMQQKSEKAGYRSKLDVESFLRHFLVGEFSGNTDTYWSTYMYKDREKVPFYVGPVWDFDLAMDNDVRIYPVSNRTDWVYRSGGSAAAGMTAFVNAVGLFPRRRSLPISTVQPRCSTPRSVSTSCAGRFSIAKFTRILWPWAPMMPRWKYCTSSSATASAG